MTWITPWYLVLPRRHASLSASGEAASPSSRLQARVGKRSLSGAYMQVNADDVQGNLVGFNKDHMRLLYVNFPDQVSARAFLTDLAAGEIDNARDALANSAEYRRRRQEVLTSLAGLRRG